MIKRINIAGIELDNYTVREMLMKIERHFDENSFTTIEEINMDTLKLAKSDAEIKETIENITYTVIADAGILNAASAESMQRKHEIENHDFFFELLKRLERNHKKVYILGENDADAAEEENFIKDAFPKIDIIGKSSIAQDNDNFENVVNDINVASPDVVLSFLASPCQEKFIMENKDKISTNLWYGIGNNKFMDKKPSFVSRLKKMLDVKKLTKIINNYEKQEEK